MTTPFSLMLFVGCCCCRHRFFLSEHQWTRLGNSCWICSVVGTIVPPQIAGQRSLLWTNPFDNLPQRATFSDSSKTIKKGERFRLDSKWHSSSSSILIACSLSLSRSLGCHSCFSYSHRTGLRQHSISSSGIHRESSISVWLVYLNCAIRLLVLILYDELQESH